MNNDIYKPAEEIEMDWNKFLDRPFDEITNEEWDNASKKASSWVTCACGNLCDIIPRKKLAEEYNTPDYGRPLDTSLSILGARFYTHISLRDLERSKKVLAEIEKRSAVLIKDIRDKQLNYTENIIVRLLSGGINQQEIANILKMRGDKPCSLSYVEKAIKRIRKVYNCKTMFQLAVKLRDADVI